MAFLCSLAPPPSATSQKPPDEEQEQNYAFWESPDGVSELQKHLETFCETFKWQSHHILIHISKMSFAGVDHFFLSLPNWPLASSNTLESTMDSSKEPSFTFLFVHCSEPTVHWLLLYSDCNNLIIAANSPDGKLQRVPCGHIGCTALYTGYYVIRSRFPF